MGTKARSPRRLAAVGALACILATGAPAGALLAAPSADHAPAREALQWDTVFRLHGTKVQACKLLTGGEVYTVKLRVDNRRGKYAVRYEKHVAKGRRLQGDVLKNIARGRTKTAAPMSVVYLDQTLKTSLWLGNRPKESKKTKVAELGSCA